MTQQRFEWTDIRAEEGLAQEAERAVIMGHDPGDGTFERTSAEMMELARNARLEPVALVSQKLTQPHPRTYLGTGKVEEARELLAEYEATVVAASAPLRPAQQRALEKLLDVPVVDRTEVILDIFAHRARSREGKIQVELAQLEYSLPRLVGRGDMLSRVGGSAGSGGGGRIGVRGPGETRLEVDRRRARSRIARLKRDIAEIAQRRALERRRDEAGPFTVALVGYTNAGKSTLLNRLTGSDVYVDDRLFATLDPTRRALELSKGRRIVLADTVGFIDRLPTTLIAAFSATLEEARDADVLLHVVDASDAQALEKITSVLDTLERIDALDVPIITVLNKSDVACELGADLPDADGESVVAISALTGDGTDALVWAIESHAERLDRHVTALIPFTEMPLLSEVHQRGTMLEEEYLETGVRVVARVPDDLVGRLRAFAVPAD